MRPTENEGRPTPHGGGNGIRGKGCSDSSPSSGTSCWTASARACPRAFEVRQHLVVRTSRQLPSWGTRCERRQALPSAGRQRRPASFPEGGRSADRMQPVPEVDAREVGARDDAELGEHVGQVMSHRASAGKQRRRVQSPQDLRGFGKAALAAANAQLRDHRATIATASTSSTPSTGGLPRILLRGRYASLWVICHHLNVWDCGIPAGRRPRACWVEHASFVTVKGGPADA